MRRGRSENSTTENSVPEKKKKKEKERYRNILIKVRRSLRSKRKIHCAELQRRDFES